MRLVIKTIREVFYICLNKEPVCYGSQLYYMGLIMEVKFDEKFEEILTEELSEFNIDRSLIEIEYVPYNFQLVGSLPIDLGQYMIRMKVLTLEGEIPDIDNWFRSHKFIYAMMSKSVRTDNEQMDMMKFDVGTIRSIATKIHDIFRDFR